MSVKQNDRLAETSSEGKPPPSPRGMPVISVSAITLSAVITVTALAGVIVHLADPKLKVDSIVVALLVIAIIPWLGLIFKSVEIPGLFKGEFQDLTRRVERDSARIDKVENAVDNEVEDLGGALQEARKAAPAHPTVVVMPGQDPKRRLEDLIKEYNHIREEQPAGNPRTVAMTAVVQEMIDLAPQLQDFDWATSLKSTDRGVRLAAYAFLYAFPRREAVDSLVHTAVYVEDKPFAQYWALLALERATDQLDCDTARRVKPILESFLRSLRPGTDRYRVLRRLLPNVEEVIRQLCSEP